VIEWKYRARTLDKDLALNLAGEKVVEAVSDELRNIYNWVISNKK
jgi:hypothetical protein